MLEPNSTAAVAAKGLAAAKGFWNRLEPSLQKKIWVKVEKHFTDFSDYLSITHIRASTVQLICSRSVNSDIEKIYVPAVFKKRGDGSTSILDNDLISDIRDGKRIVVRGNGGSGKTLFMKRLWIDVFNEPKGKIPVMIELRKFNQISNIDLPTLIRNTLSTSKNITENLFRELASDGAFLLVFDGFDEVAVERREEVESQILEFERLYKQCNIVVSSRPNENFIGWQVFHVFDVVPFTRDQTLSLVAKVPLDEGLLKSFIKLVSVDFFEKYEEFLSSPLLALMMLVTFKRKGDISDISDNIIEFYDSAFHALYSEHDAIKEQYKRPHCLKINDFRLVFSTFCLFTYYKEKFEFKEAEIHEYVQKSIEHVNLTKDPNNQITCTVEEFLHEVLDAVNLMTKDGIMYLFIHRSFQEYFSAYWIISVDSKRTDKILEDICLRPNDNVFVLCYQMNKAKVDENYVLPYYKRLIDSKMIFKSKPQNKARWQYLEAYNFSPIWRLIRSIKNKENGKKEIIPHIMPTWESGEVGIYYSNIDAIVFNGELRQIFMHTVRQSLESCRPSWLIRDFYNEKNFESKKVDLKFHSEKISIFLHEQGQPSQDVTEMYFNNDQKFQNKLKAALDEIETMLHRLNKMVNTHINAISQGHNESEKSLDEMFF